MKKGKLQAKIDELRVRLHVPPEGRNGYHGEEQDRLKLEIYEDLMECSN